MSPIAMLLTIWSLLVLSALGQELPQNESAGFRHNCSTPGLDGTILTAPCKELCSVCHSFYVSSIDLNKCIGYDGGDSLMPKKDGNYGNACKHCFTNWEEPDVLHCQCQGHDDKIHDASLDLNAAVGTRCGRLSCQDYTHELGRPLVSTEPDSCLVNSQDPRGQRAIAKPTSPPELLYVRRGQVFRQFPSNSTTAGPWSETVSVIITLTDS
ncbi:Cyanovirin-N [Coniochaeta sp. PMI_546]|nr:Cyanovirin-N [Coniochaeta sp. PMI_546]